MLLTFLIVIAIAGFMLTRSAAASNRRMRADDAAEWYRRGEQMLGAGRAADAVTALRRATAKDPDKREYALRLAAALVADHHDNAAEQVLLRLRERQPDLPEANLALGRLEARRADVTAATRYYQHALTGLWTSDRPEERRRIRLELVRFLLDHDQRSRALSELLVLAVTLPDTVPAHLEAGRLFLEAGDPGRGREQFEAVLRVEPENIDAHAGAGEASFALGDYARAWRYLPARSDDPHVSELRALAQRVLGQDPLAPRLRHAERLRRLDAAVTQARGTLEACVAGLPPDAASRGALESLRAEADAIRAQLGARRSRQSGDLVEDGTDLAYRIERAVDGTCGVTTVSDKALLLIGRRHGLDPQ